MRELLGHVGDGERVFGYRALTFSRFDAASLPGFDEVTWTPHGHFAAAPLRELADEFVALRRANLQMLRRLEEPQWRAGGQGDGKPITVRALAYVMAGTRASSPAGLTRPLRNRVGSQPIPQSPRQ